MINFIETMLASKRTTFEFTAVRRDVRPNDDGNYDDVFIFTVEDTSSIRPIVKKIQSSTTVREVIDGKAVTLHHVPEKYDEIWAPVLDLKPEELFGEYRYTEDFDGKKAGFVTTEPAEGAPVEVTGKGTYKGDLFLDVSKSRKLYLVAQKFADSSKNYYKNKNNSRLKEMLENMEAAD